VADLDDHLRFRTQATDAVATGPGSSDDWADLR
jgi:hypothetical protein